MVWAMPTTQPQTPSSVLKKQWQTEAGEGIWIGTLSKNSRHSIFAPSHYCVFAERQGVRKPALPFADRMGTGGLDYNKPGTLYRGFDYRLGTTNLHSSTAQTLEKSAAWPLVVVKGKLQKDLTQRIQRLGDCHYRDIPVMQLRSDWGSPECGSRLMATSMRRLQDLSYIQVRTIQNLPMLRAERYALGLRVTVHNILPFALPSMSLVAHFEDGPGRPRKRLQTFKLPELASGSQATVEIPAAEFATDRSKTGSPEKLRTYFRNNFVAIRIMQKLSWQNIPVNIRISVAPQKLLQ
jgi:hypothetical protein